jgi:DNA-binding response OmpR family regulator
MTPPEYSAPRVVALVDDLMFASRIAGTLGAQGYDVVIAGTVDAVQHAARVRMADGILVSFASPLLDWRGAIQAFRTDTTLRDVPLLAFGPHVDMEARAAAKAAGADRVVTNGAFFARMVAIVGALVSNREAGEPGSTEEDGDDDATTPPFADPPPRNEG